MKILEEVKGAASIAVSGHENPDGDCVGSCMGIALFLRNELPGVQVDVYLEDFSDALKRNIPGTDTIRFLEKSGKAAAEDDFADADYDVFICLDSTSERIGAARILFDRAKKTINIDHHMSNRDGCAQVNYVDPAASSACELVYDVIEADRLSEDAARALYVGMVTDTGVFRYSNTSEKTMRTAGKLMSYGFDFPAVIREVFFEKTFVQNRIMGKALSQCRSELGGKCIVCVLHLADMEEYGAGRKDLDGISSQMVMTEGADCSIFAHETEPGIYKFSLRSNSITDVARVASLYGGGGHIRAAGATVEGGFEEALKTMLLDVERQLCLTES